MGRLPGWKCWLWMILLVGCAPTSQWQRVPSGIPTLRVLLREDADVVKLSAGSSLRIMSIGKGQQISSAPSSEVIEVELLGGGRVLVRTGGEAEGSAFPLPLEVLPADDRSPVSVGGRPYRGKIQLREGNPGMLVINVVDVESYLRGVVPAEIGYLNEKTLEAVKAQAVAARTYALKRIGSKKGQYYDLVATVADQVYEGKKAEQPLADRAIRETGGLVAVHRRKLIDAYYSSTCGGRTAAIRDVWDKEDAPYLRGVRDCPQGKSDTREAYCGSSRYFEWTVTWGGQDLERILAKSLPQVLGKTFELGQVKDIRVKGTYRCGRVKKLEVRTTTGTYRVGGDRIRWVLRQPGTGNALWSTKFDLKLRRSRGRINEVIASGHGFGHGVGMCQEGAIQMAKQGKRFDQILKHYYPETRLQKILYEPVL